MASVAATPPSGPKSPPVNQRGPMETSSYSGTSRGSPLTGNCSTADIAQFHPRCSAVQNQSERVRRYAHPSITPAAKMFASATASTLGFLMCASANAADDSSTAGQAPIPCTSAWKA